VGCNSSSPPGNQSSSTSSGTANNNATTLLVWSGTGINADDLGCLLTSLSQQGVAVDLVDESNLENMTSASLAGYMGLLFPDGSSSEVLSTLPQAEQQLIQSAVNLYGLHLIAVGGTSGIAGNLGLIPTSSSFWSELLQIVEVVLDGVSLFFPQAAVISQFLNGLPAIVQTISGLGTVSLFAPSGTTPSCGIDQSTPLPGGTENINPLETLIQLIEGLSPAPSH
jgi:hypothetical protein